MSVDPDEYEQYLSEVFDIAVETRYMQYEHVRDEEGNAVTGCFRTMPAPMDE